MTKYKLTEKKNVATPKRRMLPVTQQVDGRQHLSRGGGYVFEATDMQYLRRFLLLGAGGNYYATDPARNLREAAAVLENIEPLVGLTEVVNVAEQRLAASLSPLMFAYAQFVKRGNTSARAYAYRNFGKLAVTGRQMFELYSYLNDAGVSGSGLKRAVQRWYERDDIAYQVAKYASGSGWTHRDVLRMIHPHPQTELQNDVFKYCTTGEVLDNPGMEQIAARKRAMSQDTSVEEVVGLIRKHRLTHEMIGSHFKKNPLVWDALLDYMPERAVLWNLARFSALGVNTDRAIQKLYANKTLHPLKLFMALMSYKQGENKNLVWEVDRKILAALETTLAESFKHQEPTGKRIAVIVDNSGSMQYPMGDYAITARDTALLIARTILMTEEQAYFGTFCDHYQHRSPDPLGSLLEFDKSVPSTYQSTNPTSAIMYYLNHKLPVDMFVFITDNEANTGGHTFQAIRDYRTEMSLDTKIVYIALATSNSSLVDPDDALSFEIQGFDPSIPDLISKFGGM